MSWLTLAQVADFAQGEIIPADAENIELVGVARDSRQVSDGELFLAIAGERFDGHDYVVDVADKAAAVLVQRRLPVTCPQIVVDDVRLAMGRIATKQREMNQSPVIALTGSNGKTTVKEMLGSILGLVGQTHLTEGNLNNDLGVPLTLFKRRAEHDFSVIEMGANHPGEIAYLTKITKPDVAILNNAGEAHLEGFGSLEGVAKAKAEIYQGLPKDGVAVINADDQFVDFWQAQTQQYQQCLFGFEQNADVRGENHAKGLIIHCEQGTVEVPLLLLGVHNKRNALAAAAAALAVGVSLEDIKEGLSRMRPVSGRLELRQGLNGMCVINDTYNANPGSFKAAIDVLADMQGERYLVMGDMGELGRDEKKAHQEVGEYAKANNVTRLLVTGPLSKNACDAFGDKAQHFIDMAALQQYLCQQDWQPTDVVLVKGSRSAAMERAVSMLLPNIKEAAC